MGGNGNSIFSPFFQFLPCCCFSPSEEGNDRSRRPGFMGGEEGGEEKLVLQTPTPFFSFLGGGVSRKMSPTTKKRGTDKGRRRDRFPIFAPPPLFRSLFLGGFKKDKERSFRTSFTFSCYLPATPHSFSFFFKHLCGKAKQLR